VSIKTLLFLPLLVPLFAQECVVNIRINAQDGSTTTINIHNKKACIVNLTIEGENNESNASLSLEGIEKMITLAKSKIGSKYEDTKIGPDTFDCSGFVYYVFKEHNITLPRSSLDQSKIEGKSLSKEELKRGDLVFFDTDQKGYVNHSGIYLTNGEFIHASSGKAYSVTVSNLISGWYRDKFLWGKRKAK
jgi:cell wall-associated NlpC family hydrolase